MNEEQYTNFVNGFSNVLCDLTKGKCFSEVICLCIGTDRVIGDSFGPMVGEKLITLFENEKCLKVIGNLKETVNSNNIVQTIQLIKNNYENPFIIAIDSAISNYRGLGDIVVSKESVKIAAGMNRIVDNIGDMSIKGVVARKSKISMCNFKLLQTTHLNLVMNMANIVANRNI